MKNKISLICVIMFSLICKAQVLQSPAHNKDSIFTYDKMPEVLPTTKPLTTEGDLSTKMLDGAHKFIEEKINESITTRLKLWNRDLTSQEAYEKSVEPNRRRLMKYIGVEDKNEPSVNYNVGIPDKHPQVLMQKFSINNDPDIVAETEKYRVYQVRWPVLNRVYGEGLLLQPKTKPKANIIAIPDADQEPEQLVGLLPGIPVESQFARLLAENGFQVLIPVIIGRNFLSPGKEQQQTYREWIYRQAFHMGRHIIGYEVQKVLSVIDWFKQSSDKDVKIGIAGYCEGGLIAFYSGAVDKRIDAVLVSGYFNSRQRVWDEPIYRNVWGLLSEFGDAEIAADNRSSFDPQERQIRQVKEIEDHVQWLLRDSDKERNRFFLYKVMPEFGERIWSTKPYHLYYSPGQFIEAAKKYRKFFWEEILGKFDDTLLVPNPSTRKIYDKE